MANSLDNFGCENVKPVALSGVQVTKVYGFEGLSAILAKTALDLIQLLWFKLCKIVAPEVSTPGTTSG
jgi:hypothetical protein